MRARYRILRAIQWSNRNKSRNNMGASLNKFSYTPSLESTGIRVRIKTLGRDGRNAMYHNVNIDPQLLTRGGPKTWAGMLHRTKEQIMLRDFSCTPWFHLSSTALQVTNFSISSQRYVGNSSLYLFIATSTPQLPCHGSISRESDSDITWIAWFEVVNDVISIHEGPL